MEENNKQVSLMSLVGDWKQIESALIESGGELTPEIEAFYMSVADNLGTKSDSYKFILDRMEMEEEFWKRREQESARVKKLMQSAQQRLKDTMKFAMETMNLPEIQGESYKVKLSNSKPTLEVTDMDAIPAELIIEKVEVVRSLNREKILSLIESGESVPGVRLLPVKSLRFTASKGAR